LAAAEKAKYEPLRDTMQKSNVQQMQELSPQEIMEVSGAGSDSDSMGESSYPNNYPEGQVTTGSVPDRVGP
jgi:hypothetical protein